MSQQPTGGPSLKGWMQKKGGLLGSRWQRRHFRLQDYQLMYSKTDDESVSEQHSFSIQDAKVDVVPKAKYNKREYVLELFSKSESRTYIVQAESKEAMLDWISTIRAAVQSYGAAVAKMNADSSDDEAPDAAPAPPVKKIPAPPGGEQKKTIPPPPPAGMQNYEPSSDEADSGEDEDTVDVDAFSPPSAPRASMQIMAGLPGLPLTRKPGQSVAEMGAAMAELSRFGKQEEAKEADEDDDIMDDIPDISERDIWFRYERTAVPEAAAAAPAVAIKEVEEEPETEAPPPPAAPADMDMNDIVESGSEDDSSEDEDSDDAVVGDGPGLPPPPPQINTPPATSSAPATTSEDGVEGKGHDSDDEGEVGDDVPSYVYFNPVTNQVLTEDPATMTPAERIAKTNQFGALAALQGEGNRDIIPSQKARRNSAIITEAAKGAKFEQKVDKRTRIAITLRDIIDNCQSILDTNVGGPIMMSDMDVFHDMIEKVTQIKDDIYNANATIEEEDSRTDTQSMLSLADHPWNFDNAVAHNFRAKVAQAHAEGERVYQEWHMPQYFSDLPLPSSFLAGKIIVQINVRIPTKREPQKIKIHITKNTTVIEAIETAYEKYKNNLGDAMTLPADDLVLKIVGAEAFLTGKNMVLDYEDIRRELRQQKSLDLQLMASPQPVEEKDSNETEYRATVKPELKPVNRDDYKVANMDKNLFNMGVLSMSSIATPYRVRVCGLDNCTQESLPRMGPSVGHLWMETFLFVGNRKIPGTIHRTSLREFGKSPRWLQWYTSTGVNYSTLPSYTRVGFMVYGKKVDINKDILLAWSSMTLVDAQGELSNGAKNIKLWPIAAKVKDKHGGKPKFDPDFIFKASTRENLHALNPVVLHVEFETFVLPVVAPLIDDHKDPSPMKVGHEYPMKSLSRANNKMWKNILTVDALHPLTDAEKELVWMCRHHLVEKPEMLHVFLNSVDWTIPDHASEARRLLQIWNYHPAVPVDYAIQFLDFKYPDMFVRRWAVEKLDTLPDHSLKDYILQLVQCLKYEPYHGGPLKDFMLRRALKNPVGIGHLTFWLLKAELHMPYFCERFGLILEEYLAFAGRHSRLLRVQDTACNKLVKISEKIIRLTRANMEESVIKETYKQDLEHLNKSFFLPAGGMFLPSDPRKRVMTLDVKKCRYMSSKMVPLWLVFQNADPNGSNVYLMFKSGDDLRQDMLTLQLLNIMDKIWLADGLDMRLKPYNVIATGVNDHGTGVGMIQPVINSDTISGIQVDHGGGAIGALKLDPLDLFIRSHNPGKQQYEKAQVNFTRSSAGYLVATYILGIGDRHNGNIMLTHEGHLFHIDFGHFLGNFKSKMGFNRERTAFVFTPEMAFVMGGHKTKLFKSFLGLCSSGYAVLRKNTSFFEVLFALMVPAGMPELMVEADVNYFRDKMALNKTLEKADKILRDEVRKSLASRYRRFDNMIHNFKHN